MISLSSCQVVPLELTLSQLIPCEKAIESIPETTARRLQVVPLALIHSQSGYFLYVGCENPRDALMKERLGRHLSSTASLLFVAVNGDGIPDALNKCYGKSRADRSWPLLIQKVKGVDKQHALPDGYIVDLFESLLRYAHVSRATDIHIKPNLHSFQILFRVDGVLQSIETLPGDLHSRLVVRVKVLAMLDIADSRLPQDGRFSCWISAEQVDCRVATFPTMHNERLVIRLLRRQRCLTLDDMSLPNEHKRVLTASLLIPNGLTLICGPTGSGKSTSLHALLNKLASDRLNIMTLEDPVEIVQDSINQTSIDVSCGFDYINGLKALLRQDPDVFMIGELRDQESCLMALQAAATGHRVFSTLHATNVVTCLSRLMSWNVERPELLERLNLIIAQRLVRTVCVQCVGVMGQECMHCFGTGYSGRTVVMEVLKVDNPLKQRVGEDMTRMDLISYLSSTGFITMYDSALQLVEQGKTTMHEIERVFGPEPLTIDLDRLNQSNVCTIAV